MTSAVGEARLAVKVIEKIASSLDSIKRHVSKESEELVLRLPEFTGEYSVAVRIKPGNYGGRVHFAIPGLSTVHARALPTFHSMNEAFVDAPDGFTFDPSKLPDGVDLALLQFDFQLPQNQDLTELVQRNTQLDSSKSEDSDYDSYWMTAQIKHPAYLKKTYSRLELYGVDFHVDVGVHQDIKNSIPHGVMRAIQRSAEFLGTTDREKLLRLMLEQRKMTQAQQLPDAVRDLVDIFQPLKFRKFVDVNSPFRFEQCLRGTEFFERLYLALPKFMTVVSRTDLTLEEPAKNGTLVFRKGKVREEISKLFPGSKPGS